MEIFNIGLPELFIFLILAFILLGPKDMVLTAYKVGESVRKFVRSPIWKEILKQAQEIRELPTKLMDETGLKEELESIQKDTQDAVKEVNTSIKEAVDAARVPEAEHIKLDTTLPTTPASGTVPATTTPASPAPVSSSSSQPAMPAVFDGAPIPGLAKLPESSTPEAANAAPTQTAASQPPDSEKAAEKEAAAVKSSAAVEGTVSEPPREIEAVAVQEPAAQMRSEAQPAAVGQDSPEAPPLARKRATRKKKSEETPQSEAGVADAQSAPLAEGEPSAASGLVDSSSIEEPAASLPRKRAVRKKKVEEPVSEEPAAEAPGVAEAIEVEQQPEGASESQEPARRKRAPRPKVEAGAEESPTAQAAPDAPARKARARKSEPKAEEPAVE